MANTSRTRTTISPGQLAALDSCFGLFFWHIVKHGLDWICKTRAGFVKHGFVKRGFVKHGFVKHGFVKHGFVKHGFVKGGLSFFVKNDCLTVNLFISVCPFLILILYFILFSFYVTASHSNNFSKRLFDFE